MIDTGLLPISAALAGGGTIGAIVAAVLARWTDREKLSIDQRATADRHAIEQRSNVDTLALELLRGLRTEVAEVKATAQENLQRYQDCEAHRHELRAEVEIATARSDESSARHEAELRVQQEQIRLLQQQAHSVADGATSFEVLADPDGMIIDVTDGVSPMLGYRPAELVGKHIHTLAVEPSPDRHAEAFALAIEEGVDRGRLPVHGLARHRSGVHLPVHVIIERDTDTGGYWAVVSHAARTLRHSGGPHDHPPQA